MIQEVTRLDPMDVDARLDELSTLRDGWLDGQGKALDHAGLKWFSEKFGEQFPSDLDPPYLYPTLNGRLQAEWSLGDYEIDLEIDLLTHCGEWDEAGPGKHDFSAELDLNERRDWARIIERIRSIGSSIQ